MINPSPAIIIRPKNTCTTILFYHKNRFQQGRKSTQEKIESVIETLETCMAAGKKTQCKAISPIQNQFQNDLTGIRNDFS
jgi:Cu/Ag efflux pump CusA